MKPSHSLAIQHPETGKVIIVGAYDSEEDTIYLHYPIPRLSVAQLVLDCTKLHEGDLELPARNQNEFIELPFGSTSRIAPMMNEQLCVARPNNEVALQ